MFLDIFIGLLAWLPDQLDLLLSVIAELHNLVTEIALDLIFPRREEDEQKQHKEAVMYQQDIHFHVLFDGGSRGNGSAGQQGYGSFLIHNGSRHSRHTREFGHITNNAAEYSALIEALRHLIAAIDTAGKSPSKFNIRVVGDSLLVLNQVKGDWKVKAAHLQPLHLQVRQLAARFRSVCYEHTGRETCVRLLGH